MSSTQYLDFIGSVWSSLPEEDQARLGELWQGMEQVFAAVYQKYLEGNLNIVHQDLQTYSTERWLPYTFDSSNLVSEPATFTSSQDLSLGVNLTTKYLLKLSVNGGAPIEVDCRGRTPNATTIDEVAAAINQAFRFAFASGVFSDSVLKLTSSTAGSTSSITVLETSDPAANAAEFILGLEAASLPQSFPEFPVLFSSPYPLLASVPEFQDAVRDESVTALLTEGVDYEVQGQTRIAFKAQPPASLWARRSLFDQENPWNNFGFLMEVYQKNSPRYTSVIQGLWYAFWNGPKPDNVLRSLYLLLGLPTAREDGVVSAVTSVSIETTGLNGVVRSFDIPAGLAAIVQLGQSVAQFDPLVTGVAVYDKINKPGFVADEIGRAGIQRFLTDNASRGDGDTDETRALTLLEEVTFLPQISVDAFIYPDVNLGNVRTFLNAIKPLNKTYVFQITSGDIQEPLDFQDLLGSRLDIDLTENVDSNQTTSLDALDLLAYETAENSGLNLDPGGVLFQETLTIDVFSFGLLIDSYSA